jgi:L-ribulose-5-phosphate 3-epimerase UlaE
MEPTYSRTGVRVITVCFGCTNTELLGSKADVFDDENKDIMFKAIAGTHLQR